MPKPLPDSEPETEQNRRGRLFLEDQRLDVGLQWSEVARDMLKLYGVKISTDYLYKIKRGAAPLSKMSVDAREAMRKVLRIGAEDWTAETGLYSPDATPVEDSRSAPPDFTVDIPTELLEAAEMYQEIDPLIAHPTVQQQLARAGFFGGGPQTPQQWIRYFNDIREWIKVEH